MTTANPPENETILQFGCGNFLRAFTDLFAAQEARRTQLTERSIIAVQSTGNDRALALRENDHTYHVAIRGFEGGRTVDEVALVDSISRVIIAREEWRHFLETAEQPGIRWIVSNVTESGLMIDPHDSPNSAPPSSFPAKLTVWLYHRWKSNGSPVTVLPCELVPENGAQVRNLVQKVARLWKLDSPFQAWAQNECRWINNLVDRIVSGRPASHPLLASDPLLLVTEPFAQWVLETEGGNDFPLAGHPSLIFTQSIEPYHLRKVRILNGAHTALVIKAMPLGFKIVREAVADDRINDWLRQLLFDEIVPVLEGRVENPKLFAEQTIERFNNPFLDHQLSDIAKGQEQKVALRLQSTREEYRERFGTEPPLLSKLLKGNIP